MLFSKKQFSRSRTHGAGMAFAAALLLGVPTVFAQPAATPAAAAQPAAGIIIQGFSSDRLARIAPSMQEQVRTGMFPGAVTMVARNGVVVHNEAHGFLDAAKSKPMPKDALFRLASMTKPIVTVAAMMMVEQGKMGLNDPITKWRHRIFAHCDLDVHQTHRPDLRSA